MVMENIDAILAEFAALETNIDGLKADLLAVTKDKSELEASYAQAC